MKKDAIYTLIFVLAVGAMSVYYDYQHLLFMRPQGDHQWRQCDGAMMARNYYYKSMNLFQPRLNNLRNSDGKVVGEFPITYYAAACGYKIFGFHEFILRLVHLFIFYLGLYYLYKSIRIILDDHYYALVCSLLLFTSAVIIFYANNFLPDVPALAFTLIGYYYFLRFTMPGGATGNLAWSALCFALAGLLKITALVGLAAMASVLVFDYLQKLSQGHKPEATRTRAFTLFLLASVLPALLWLGWAKYFKMVSGNDYFLQYIVPIWALDTGQIRSILGRLHVYWLGTFFYRPFINISPILILAIFAIPKWPSRTLLLWFAAFLAGSAIYGILFFGQFYWHDYYGICIMLIPVALCVILLLRLKDWYPALYNSAYLKTAMFVLLITCAYQGRLIEKYKPLSEIPHSGQFAAMMDIEPYLEQKGIGINDKVISLGDITGGVSLYLMNRDGWCQYLTHGDSSDIERFMSMGARYIITQPGLQDEYPPLSAKFTSDKIGEHKGAVIYRLPH